MLESHSDESVMKVVIADCCAAGGGGRSQNAVVRWAQRKVKSGFGAVK